MIQNDTMIDELLQELQASWTGCGTAWKQKLPEIRANLIEQKKTFSKRFNKGYNLLLKGLEKEAAVNSRYLIPEDKLEALCQNPLFEGKSYREHLEIPEDVINDYHQIAKKILEEKRSEDARDAFTFLSTLDPFYNAFWIGLGYSLEALDAFEEALSAYSSGASICKNKISCYIEILRLSKNLGDNEMFDACISAARKHY